VGTLFSCLFGVPFARFVAQRLFFVKNKQTVFFLATRPPFFFLEQFFSVLFFVQSFGNFFPRKLVLSLGEQRDAALHARFLPPSLISTPALPLPSRRLLPCGL
jgi:hypothetical protein